MSITQSYRRVTETELARLLDDPDAAAAFFGDDIDEDDEDAYIAFYAARDESDAFLDIGKAWAAIHFLLTGLDPLGPTEAPPPLGEAIQGGDPTEWEATYGVVRILPPDRVRATADALAAIDDDAFAARFDPAALNAARIYPGGDWDDEALPWLSDVYAALRAFFADAAVRGDALLISSD